MQNILKTLSISLITATPFLAMGQDVPISYPQQIPGSFRLLINSLVGYAVYAIISIAVVMIVWAAWTFLTSQGDPASTKKARDIVIYAVIAVAVALLASAIVRLVVQAVPGGL